MSHIAGFLVFIALIFFIPKYTNAPLNDVELYIFTIICMLLAVKFFFLNKETMKYSVSDITQKMREYEDI